MKKNFKNSDFRKEIDDLTQTVRTLHSPDKRILFSRNLKMTTLECKDNKLFMGFEDGKVFI